MASKQATSYLDKVNSVVAAVNEQRKKLIERREELLSELADVNSALIRLGVPVRDAVRGTRTRGKLQLLVLAFAAEHDEFRLVDAARATGRTSTDLGSTLPRLAVKGLVEKVAHGTYRITEAGLEEVKSAQAKTKKDE